MVSFVSLILYSIKKVSSHVHNLVYQATVFLCGGMILQLNVFMFVYYDMS